MNDSPSVRAESAAQLVLMLGVGSVAACASWSHVVDLAEQNGQPGWLAVADAAVLETLAVSMGLDVRRRRRNGESTRFALCVLVAAVVLQLAAQVAQAPVTFWGWTMAALPAVGFLLLVKVAMTRTAAVLVPSPAPVDDLSPVEPVAAPVADRAGDVAPVRADEAASTGAGEGTSGDLLATGRSVAEDLARHDARLTRATLIAGLRGRGVRVGTDRASQLLTALRTENDRPTAAQDLANHEHERRDRHLSAVGAGPRP